MFSCRRRGVYIISLESKSWEVLLGLDEDRVSKLTPKPAGLTFKQSGHCIYPSICDIADAHNPASRINVTDVM
jgi:hypothetical protein